jgi:hypothetical protein
MSQIGRNTPCPCGSGKKYKKCCLTDEQRNHELKRAIRLSHDDQELQNILKEKQKHYRFKVELVRMSFKEPVEEVSRIIEIPGNATLYDFHLWIQKAFDWDNDHMFSFYLSEDMNDRSKEYSANPFGEHVVSIMQEPTKPAAEAEVRDLELKKGMTFLYLFDYGDELLHKINIEDISEMPEGEPIKARIVSQTGKAPDQYNY